MRSLIIFAIPAITWVSILTYDRILKDFSDKFIFANLAIMGACSFLLIKKFCINDRSTVSGLTAIILNLLLVFVISNSKEIYYVNIGMLFSLFLIFLSSFRYSKYISALFVFLVSIGAFAVSVFAEYTNKFGSIAAILQTNEFEAFYYFSEFFSWWPILAVGIAILAYIGTKLFLQKLERLPSPQSLTLVLIPIACLMMAGATPLMYKSYMQVLDLTYSLEFFYSERKLEREVLSKLERLKETANKAPLSVFPGNIIVIIGKSVSRNHMSLYGYHRATTPNLDELASQLIIFKDAVSPVSSTLAALITAFTPASYAFKQDDSSVYLKYYENNLLTIARKIGLYTAWISNQIEYGFYENPTDTLAKFANKTFFTSSSVGARAENFGRSESFDTPDTAMIGELKNLLEDRPQNNLIFLHMDAVNFPYCHHASDQFIKVRNNGGSLGGSFFGEAEDRSVDTNCYDSEIRNVDHFVREVFTVALNITAPTMVLFFSDHGEAPTLGTGHHLARHSHYHNEVPLLVLFNQSGKNFFRREIEIAKNNIDTPILISNIYESVIDIIDRDGFHQSNSSIFSSRYQSPERILNSWRPVYYDSLGIDDAKDAFERSRITLGKIRQKNENSWRKIWAHRVNSIGKLLEAKQIFAGVEVDVVFNGTVFHVNHPPKEPTGLTLEQWLDATRDKSDLQFWLDWKNPDLESFRNAMERLEYLDRKFNIKRRTVVETTSHSIFPELAELNRRNWRNSYYLPHEDIIRCTSSDLASDCDHLAASILSSVNNVGATAISYDFSLRAFAEIYQSIFSDLDKLTWHLGISDNYMLTEQFQRELETHEVLLVPFHTYFAQ